MFKFILSVLANLDKLQEKPGIVAPLGQGQGNQSKFGVEEDIAILREGREKPEEKVEDEEENDDSGTEEEEELEEEETTEDTEDDEGDRDEDSEEEQEETDEEVEETEEETDEEHKITVKGIKKDFPDFFKKHPEMKGVIFREKQFSELFATPQDAQDASRLAGQFQMMENDLMQGDSAPLFDAIKKANGGKNYEGFISNLLPNLEKSDKDTYYKVVAVPIKKALRAAFHTGIAKGDKNLAYSAQWLNEFLFNDSNLDKKVDFEEKAKPTEKTKEQEEYEKKLEQLNNRDHINFKSSIDASWVAGVEKFFLDGLDPDGILSDWTKKKMVEEAVTQLNEQMTKDTRYMRGIETLWQQAIGSGYNPGFKTRIVNTSLARAKQIIPTIRQKLRAEALNERRRITKGKEEGKGERKRVVSGQNSNGRKPLDKKSMRNMSDLDIIRS